MLPSDLSWFEPDVIFNMALKFLGNDRDKPSTIDKFQNEYKQVWIFVLIMTLAPVGFHLLILIGHMIGFIAKRATRIEWCKFRRAKNILLSAIVVIGFGVGITACVFLYQEGQDAQKSWKSLSANVTSLIEKIPGRVSFYQAKVEEYRGREKIKKLIPKLLDLALKNNDVWGKVLEHLQLDRNDFIKDLCEKYNLNNCWSGSLKDESILKMAKETYWKWYGSDFSNLTSDECEFINKLLTIFEDAAEKVSSELQSFSVESNDLKSKWQQIRETIEKAMGYLQIICVSMLTSTVVYYGVSVLFASVPAGRRRWLGRMLYVISFLFVFYLIGMTVCSTIFPIVSAGLVDVDRDFFQSTPEAIFTNLYKDVESEIKKAYKSHLQPEYNLPDYSTDLLVNLTRIMVDNWEQVFGEKEEFLVELRAFLESRPLVSIYTNFTHMTIFGLSLEVCCILMTIIVLWMGRLFRRSYYVGLETSLKKHAGLMEEYIISSAPNRKSMYFPPSPMEDLTADPNVIVVVDKDAVVEDDCSSQCAPSSSSLSSSGSKATKVVMITLDDGTKESTLDKLNFDENCGLSNLDDCESCEPGASFDNENHNDNDDNENENENENDNNENENAPLNESSKSIDDEK